MSFSIALLGGYWESMDEIPDGIHGFFYLTLPEIILIQNKKQNNVISYFGSTA